MKNVLFLVLFSSVALQLSAQLPEDALRYSWFNPSGTARNQAIGGVMGSLGGDITATYVNPAGLGMYKTGEVVFTPGFNFLKNKSNYRGTKETGSKSAFNLGPSGFVFGFGDEYNPKKSKALSLVVNQAANYNSKIIYSGANNLSSYSEQFLEELRNDRADTNLALTGYPFGSSLAYYTYLIDTLRNADGSVGGFKSLATLQSGLHQKNTITSSGGITEIALGYAINNNDKFYFGGSVGIPILSYTRNSTLIESDATTNKNNDFNYSEYNQHYSAKGAGFNLKLGMIAKPVDNLRLGLALHTPTFYGITEKSTASMTTDVENYGGGSKVISVTSDELNNNQPALYKYDLVSPWKFLVSGAYVLHEVQDVKQQRGFISADVEYVTFGSSKFSAQTTDGSSNDNSQYYNGVNNAIKQLYKGVFNFKVGGELKFNTLMVRAGFGLYGNPYKDNFSDDEGKAFKANRTNISAGLGYRNKGMFIDLAYNYTMSKNVNFPYRLGDKPNTYAVIKGNTGNAVMTVGLKF